MHVRHVPLRQDTGHAFLRAPSPRTSWSRSRRPRLAFGRQPGYERFSCVVELDGKRSWGRCMPSHNRGGTNNLEYHQSCRSGRASCRRAPGETLKRRVLDLLQGANLYAHGGGFGSEFALDLGEGVDTAALLLGGDRLRGDFEQTWKRELAQALLAHRCHDRGFQCCQHGFCGLQLDTGDLCKMNLERGLVEGRFDRLQGRRACGRLVGHNGLGDRDGLFRHGCCLLRSDDLLCSCHGFIYFRLMKMRKARHAIVETMSAHAKFGSRGVRWLDSPELRPARPAIICQAEVRMWECSSRLTAAGQVLQPDGSRRRTRPFVILRDDRPLHLQQRPPDSDVPHEMPSDSFTPRRPALRDPLQTPRHMES